MNQNTVLFSETCAAESWYEAGVYITTLTSWHEEDVCTTTLYNFVT
jgi:hypothetical protein